MMRGLSHHLPPVGVFPGGSVLTPIVQGSRRRAGRRPSQQRCGEGKGSLPSLM